MAPAASANMMFKAEHSLVEKKSFKLCLFNVEDIKVVYQDGSSSAYYYK